MLQDVFISQDVPLFYKSCISSVLSEVFFFSDEYYTDDSTGDEMTDEEDEEEEEKESEHTRGASTADTLEGGTGEDSVSATTTSPSSPAVRAARASFFSAPPTVIRLDPFRMFNRFVSFCITGCPNKHCIQGCK
jgi:hypothetical protein